MRKTRKSCCCLEHGYHTSSDVERNTLLCTLAYLLRKYGASRSFFYVGFCRVKRYSIKVENNKSVVYHGSKLLYIYLETSWEKEAWCKSLHMASRAQSEKLKWSSQLYEECHRYLASLNIEYHPFIMRPSAGSSFDALEKSSKPDGSSSRVPQFLSRITKTDFIPLRGCHEINIGVLFYF
ncbi:hypothetical protein HN51_008141 [Arachis hypogaea]